MKTQSVLTEAMLDQFKRIIKDRLPAEACGVLLPTPHRGHHIWEMPNRSMNSHDGFTMKAVDVQIQLKEWIEANPGLLTEVTFWHTHPSGNSTPSKPDLDNRVDQACNLIVALSPDDEVIFSWY